MIIWKGAKSGPEKQKDIEWKGEWAERQKAEEKADAIGMYEEGIGSG